MKKYEVEKLDHQGRGIIREDGKIIFVENALPEEEIEIEITKEKKNWKEARVIAYYKKSRNRKKPQCPYYNTCGGCHIMHMSYDKQLEWKMEKVKEILNKFMDLDISNCIQNIVRSQEWNYRNKTTFQVNQKIGYYKKSSNEVVAIKHCDIADSKINVLLSIIEKMPLKNCKQVIVRASKNKDQTMVIFDTKTMLEQSVIEPLKPYVTSIYQKGEKLSCLYGKPYIEEKLGDFIFNISPNSFFQVNTIQAENLYNLVLHYASLTKEDSVLDLYCGTGTIGLYLSRHCKKVCGIEVNEQAILDANENKKKNNISNVDFICGDVSHIVDKIKDAYHVIVVDPPRSGLDEKTISYLKRCNAKKIIYVSCDPVTLARDLNQLQACYKVQELTPVDMFPETYHVECVCVLNRR